MRRALFAPLALLLAVCICMPVTVMAQDTSGEQTVDSGDQTIGLSNVVAISPDPAETSFSYEVAVGWETGYIFDEMKAPLFYGVVSRFDYREIVVEWLPALPESVDTSAPGTYTYTGTLSAPEGCKFADGLEVPTVTLTVEVKESIPPVQLYWPEDSTFYRANGVSVAQAADEEELLSELPPWSIFLETSDGADFIFPDVSWDISGVQIGAPGDYVAKAILSLPNEQNLSKRYTLPEGTQPFSMPVHIRDDSRLEIFLNTPGPVFSGSVYLPDGAQAEEEFIPSWYVYCGEDKPTAEQLDAMTFEQDEDALTGEGTPFFYAWVVPGSVTGSGLNIDFEEIPDETRQGWYAFYVESGDLVSNYILIDSREPTFAPEYITGTRDGGQNSDLILGTQPGEDEEEEDDPSGDDPSTDPGSGSESDVDDGGRDDPDSGSESDPDSGDESDSPAPGDNGGDSSDSDDSSGSSEPNDDNGSNSGSDDNGGSSNSNDGNSNNAESSRPDVVPADALVQPIEPPDPAQTEPAAEQPVEPESKPFAEQDTETGVTLSGVRIAALTQDDLPLVVTKDGVNVHISAAALAGLKLGEEEFLSVTVTQPQENEVYLMVEIGGVPVEPVPEISVLLQNIPYDPAQRYTATHESGESVTCYKQNGCLAFTARVLGSYVIASEPVAVAEPGISSEPVTEQQPTEDIQQTAAQQTQHPSFPWIAAVAGAALLLLVLFLWRRRRDER